MNSTLRNLCDASTADVAGRRRYPFRIGSSGAAVGLLGLVLQACSFGPSTESVDDPDFLTTGGVATGAAESSATNDTDLVPPSPPLSDSSGGVASSGGLRGSESGTGETGDTDPATSELALCPDTLSCFSWCGVRKSDGECISIDYGELSPAASLLCPEIQLWVNDAEVARLGEGNLQDDVRCFMQAIRYSNEGALFLSWSSEDGLESAALRIDLHGGESADLNMMVHRDADCGEAVALWAPMAHTRNREDAIYTDCRDTNRPEDLARCLLGPGASFHTDFDVAFEVPFPWLTGYCVPD